MVDRPDERPPLPHDERTRTSPGSSSAGSQSGGTPAASAPQPEWIGRYRVVGVIGEGGMGTVYEAEQESPRRRVALKVIRPGLVTPQRLRRFELESQLLAWLQHPGIAQVYEAGTADTGSGPQPFFAMELIRGEPLDRHAAAAGLDARQRLALLARVCDAVQHAHQKGIIHRDLKPGNILVDATGQPKVLDFGVARAAEADLRATLDTGPGQFVGTLPYMSPEQVSGDPADLDTRSDVYALGVMLYELLAGRLPHDLVRQSLPEALRIIREEEPAPLGTMERTLRGDAETIAAKALEKEKERRYQSAAELAEDIRRFLRDEPIVARPASAGYQLRKFARRNRALVAALVTAAVVLSGAAVVSTWQAVRATRARAQADAVNAFLQEMLGSVDPQQLRGADVTVRHGLDAAARRLAAGALNGQPEVEATVRLSLGRTYRALGLYAESDLQLAPALETRRGVLGSDDVRTAEAMYELALLRREQGDLEASERLQREALEVRRRRLGDDDLEVARSLSSLGGLQLARGNLAEAEPLLLDALQVARRAGPPGEPEAAVALNNLAQLRRAQGDLVAAEQLYREALAIRRRTQGEGHPGLALGLNNLASLLQERGDLAAAEPLLRESLAIYRKTLGEGHPDVAQSLSNLGQLVRARGDLAAAEQLTREALAIWQAALGEAHPSVALGLNNLGQLRRAQGDLAGAEPLLRQSLAIYRVALGERSEEVARGLNNLAALLKDRGDPAAAELHYRESLAICRALYGDQHPTVARVLENLATLLLQEGRYAEAEPLLREALAIRAGRPSTARWQRASVESLLGESLAGQGRRAEAEPLLRAGAAGLADDPSAPEPSRREARERLRRFEAPGE